VSVWLGPPFIHNSKHERVGRDSLSFASAKRPSQPEADAPATAPPAAASQPRRVYVVISDLIGRSRLLRT
jgi:hypothetical protein